MWTGEQVVEGLLTNIIVRLAEVIGAPIWIWFKSRKDRRDWPTPIRIGFVIILLASCVFLEERITEWARSIPYGEEHIIRAWLDEQKLLSSFDSNKDGFTFVVNSTNRDLQFEIIKKNERQGIMVMRTGIVINPEAKNRLARLSPQQRQQLWNELRIEFSRHGMFLPRIPGDFKDLSNIFFERHFPFPPGTSKAALYQQLSELTTAKSMLDLLYETWEAQGKM